MIYSAKQPQWLFMFAKIMTIDMWAGPAEIAFLRGIFYWYSMTHANNKTKITKRLNFFKLLDSSNFCNSGNFSNLLEAGLVN